MDAYFKRTGKNALSCPLRITHCVPQEKFPKSQTRNLLINSFLAKYMDKIAGYNPCLVICMFMDVNSLACMAGIRRGGKGEKQAREVREDWTGEGRGDRCLQRRYCFLHSTI